MRLTEAAIAPISAPIFIVFAIIKREMIGSTTFLLEYFFPKMVASPLPVNKPILPHIS